MFPVLVNIGGEIMARTKNTKATTKKNTEASKESAKRTSTKKSNSTKGCN